jgi:tetratricopeptide (TPR) repeat protein
MEASRKNFEESIELFRTASNQHGIARGLTMLVIGDAQAGNWHSAIGRLEEGVAIWRRLGDRLQLAFTLIWLAFACGRARRWHEARSAGLEALDLFHDAGNATGIVLAFRDLAFISNWEGHPEEALRLAAAAAAVQEQVAGGPPPGFGGMLEGDPADDARQQLPEDVARLSWEEGLRMGVDDALVFARRHFET